MTTQLQLIIIIIIVVIIIIIIVVVVVVVVIITVPKSFRSNNGKYPNKLLRFHKESKQSS